LSLLLATLSTNIVANIIAPANSFTNAFPRFISFRAGGIIAGIIGIIICPWWLIGEISGFLLNYSAILGPLVAVMIADYYSVRNKNLSLIDLYSNNGEYYYNNGFNNKALISFAIGVLATYSYKVLPSLEILYLSSWFTGFIVSYISYLILMKKQKN
jgi:NCS1 family nucleobase:cation symporter-1